MGESTYYVKLRGDTSTTEGGGPERPRISEQGETSLREDAKAFTGGPSPRSGPAEKSRTHRMRPGLEWHHASMDVVSDRANKARRGHRCSQRISRGLREALSGPPSFDSGGASRATTSGYGRKQGPRFRMSRRPSSTGWASAPRAQEGGRASRLRSRASAFSQMWPKR